jgi:hypothetical protein
MKNNSEFISVKELREIWNVDKVDILKIVKEENFTCLPEYAIGEKIDEYEKQKIKDDIELKWIDEYYCLKNEIEAYEQIHPKLKPQEVPYVYPDGKIPPYLDPKHLHYSTELATCIEVWMQLFQSNAPIENPKYSLVNQIKKALEKKGFKGIRSAYRLASCINPDSNKRGGGTRVKKKTTHKKIVKK